MNGSVIPFDGSRWTLTAMLMTAWTPIWMTRPPAARMTKMMTMKELRFLCSIRQQLIVSAAAPINELYHGNKLKFEFERTGGQIG